ncbi:MAG: cell division ATP-binding protein FtsE [Alphaproteobacteria bacterium]|nr:cell division ATP-binding protein FtsE [Alphaproteobacteria bacterium]
MVTLENIGKRYDTGSEVLRDVSLNLEPGSFHFLTGASGAGKSTLLKILYLAEQQSRGVLNLFGTDVAVADRQVLAALRRRIGVVLQDFRLVPHLSVRENVALPLRIAGTPERQIDDNVGELLNWVGLADKMEARPATLSGGEQQRTAVARAIIGSPELLIADEPTGSVDDELAVTLVRLFERMNQLGATVVIATHNIDFVRRFAHARFHIEAGVLSGPLLP